ncbi:MAG: hypothetical protein J6Q94_04765 [Clostridia bacterium]|nr:hypothetical protein [Clostridia bacterium]
MKKERRNDIYEELRNFLEMQAGIPEEWEAEIQAITPDDSFDGLDVIVGHMCDEWGTGDTRECLSMIGADEDEIEKLIEDNFDSCF